MQLRGPSALLAVAGGDSNLWPQQVQVVDLALVVAIVFTGKALLMDLVHRVV